MTIWRGSRGRRFSLHNTIEAVLYAKENDIEAYQGGTCNETEVSAQACVQVALACRPQRLLAKPGMGFDEGMTIVNFMQLENGKIVTTSLNNPRMWLYDPVTNSTNVIWKQKTSISRWHIYECANYDMPFVMYWD